MIKRGQSSFAILFIINPIVILFFQNCSVLPVNSKTIASANASPTRVLANTETQYTCRFASSLPCAE